MYKVVLEWSFTKWSNIFLNYKLGFYFFFYFLDHIYNSKMNINKLKMFQKFKTKGIIKEKGIFSISISIIQYKFS